MLSSHSPERNMQYSYENLGWEYEREERGIVRSSRAWGRLELHGENHLTFSPRKEFASYPNGNCCELTSHLQKAYLLLSVLMSSSIILSKQTKISNTLVLGWESKTSWIYEPIVFFKCVCEHMLFLQYTSKDIHILN